MARPGFWSDAQAADQPSREQTPADRAFEPLQRDLANLHKSLINKGGIEGEDHGVIRALRDRVIAFSREFPDDVRAPKAELLLSTWLGERDQNQALLRRIIALEPSNEPARLSLARLLHVENRYDEALDLLKSHPPDPIKSPSDAWLYGECLFAEHEFEQASAVLEAIPADAIESQQRERLISMKQWAKEYIDLWQQEQDLRRSEEQADDLPRVMLVTARGPIVLELFENQAPNTVANFIHLAEEGFYDATKFHRVIPNFMAQGGDPNTKPGATGMPGQGDPGYYIPDEVDREDHRKHFTGTLAMAKTEAPNTGGCQFYITVMPAPHLNGKHTVFGRVLEGLEVARRLKNNDELQVVTVIRKRAHEYKPNTLPKVAASPSGPAEGQSSQLQTPVPADPDEAPVAPPPSPDETPSPTPPSNPEPSPSSEGD